MAAIFRRSFENTYRYYHVSLDHDLLGDLVVRRLWGGKFNRLHGEKHEVFKSHQDACAYIEIIANHRIKRGYVEVTSP